MADLQFTIDQLSARPFPYAIAPSDLFIADIGTSVHSLSTVHLSAYELYDYINATVRANSAHWEGAYNSVAPNSAHWISVFNQVSSLSSGWGATSATVDLINKVTQLSLASANWDATTALVNAQAAVWSSGASNVYVASLPAGTNNGAAYSCGLVFSDGTCYVPFEENNQPYNPNLDWQGPLMYGFNAFNGDDGSGYIELLPTSPEYATLNQYYFQDRDANIDDTADANSDLLQGEYYYGWGSLMFADRITTGKTWFGGWLPAYKVSEDRSRIPSFILKKGENSVRSISVMSPHISGHKTVSISKLYVINDIFYAIDTDGRLYSAWSNDISYPFVYTGRNYWRSIAGVGMSDGYLQTNVTSENRQYMPYNKYSVTPLPAPLNTFSFDYITNSDNNVIPLTNNTLESNQKINKNLNPRLKYVNPLEVSSNGSSQTYFRYISGDSGCLANVKIEKLVGCPQVIFAKEVGTNRWFAWGNNQYGHLGIGSTVSKTEPVEMPQVYADIICPHNAYQLPIYALGVTASANNVYSWGAGVAGGINFHGESQSTQYTSPHLVPVWNIPISKVVIGNQARAAATTGSNNKYTFNTAVDASFGVATNWGGNYNDVYAYFLSTTGHLSAMGNNYGGCLGTATSINGNISSPTKILPHATNTATVTNFFTNGGSGSYKYLGNICTYMLASDGKVYAVGMNRSGELGTGNFTSVSPYIISSPTAVKVLSGYPTYPAAGAAVDLNPADVSKFVMNYNGNRTCTFLLTNDNKLFAAGYNEHGELGIGFKGNVNVFYPVQTHGNRISDIIVSSYLPVPRYRLRPMLALTTDGSLMMI